MLIQHIWLLAGGGFILTILSVLRQNERNGESTIFSAMAVMLFFIAGLYAVNPESHVCIASSGVPVCTFESMPKEHFLSWIYYGLAMLNSLFVYISMMDNFGRRDSFEVDDR